LKDALSKVDPATIGLTVLAVFLLAQLGVIAKRSDVEAVQRELVRVQVTLEHMQYWNPGLVDSIPSGPVPR
jgi:uncharacterized membrane protein (Fun14 family)